MIRLAKYVKPFIPLLVIAVILLFVKSVSDLSLPNYLSKIVNVGIQQGGVENAVPEAVRQTEMNRLFLFVSADDKAEVLKQYTLVDKNSPDYNQDVKEYPALANGPIYVLNTVDQAEIARLNPIPGKAWVPVSGIEQVIADPAKAAPLGTSVGIDLSKLPKGPDLFALVSLLPAQTRTAMLDTMTKKFSALGDNMITQSAVGAVKNE